MINCLSILIVFAVLTQQALAQPTEAQVKTDFLKNGVTAVEGIVINKEWYKDHYLWKASFRTILPVKPADVDGLAGVTMIRHVVAHYEGNKKTWSGLVYSEYKGINLPSPSNDELAQIVLKQMQSDPSKLVRSMSSKVSFDSVKVTAPEIDWVNPRKLQFVALLYYKDNVNNTEIGVIESPLGITLERTALTAPLTFRSSYQYFEKNKEITRYKSGGATGNGAPIANVTEAASGSWKTGDKVMVEENGKWYPATVLQVKSNEWFIHYDGYDSKYDLWVGISRIKNK